MNYNLAKKLKDAGFPFRIVRHGAKMGETEKFIEFIPDSDVFFYLPTLSELIEACEDGLRRLVREPQPNGTVSWWCESPFPHEAQNHKTPEEAAANLWLALNNHERKV